MEGVLNKTSIYDFFGILLSGMIVLLAGFFLQLPFGIADNISSDALKTVLFVLESYFLGLTLQEITSWLDRNFLKFRRSYTSDFLNDSNMVFTNEHELLSVRKMANSILRRETDNTSFSESDCEYVFLYCQTYLEVTKNNQRVEAAHSWYAMGRSLVFAFPVLLVCYIIAGQGDIDALRVAVLIIFTLIFFNRMKRVGLYWVLLVLRHYNMLMNIRNQD